MRKALLALMLTMAAVVLSGCAGAGQTQASCVGPSLRVEPERVAPGGSFEVRGRSFFVGCDDIGPDFTRSKPERDIRLAFEQGGKKWRLTTVDADRDYSFFTKARVPANAKTGRAIIVASHGNGTTTAPFRVTRDQDGKPQAFPDESRPPDSALSFGEQSATGSLGSYCWSYQTSATQGVSQCADMVRVSAPDKDKRLIVPQGSVLKLDYGGDRHDSASASASPIRRKEQVGSEMKTLHVRRRGERVLIPATLPPGEYVLDVFLRVPEGSVSYGFRVLVEPEGQPAS